MNKKQYTKLKSYQTSYKDYNEKLETFQQMQLSIINNLEQAQGELGNQEIDQDILNCDIEYYKHKLEVINSKIEHWEGQIEIVKTSPYYYDNIEPYRIDKAIKRYEDLTSEIEDIKLRIARLKESLDKLSIDCKVAITKGEITVNTYLLSAEEIGVFAQAFQHIINNEEEHLIKINQELEALTWKPM